MLCCGSNQFVGNRLVDIFKLVVFFIFVVKTRCIFYEVRTWVSCGAYETMLRIFNFAQRLCSYCNVRTWAEANYFYERCHALINDDRLTSDDATAGCVPDAVCRVNLDF